MKKNAKKTIRTFAAASFLNDFGADMVHSLWPMFLTQVLGVNMAILGLIDGIGESLVSISQAVSGYWSDRLRRRKIFIWIGYLFGSVARFGYAISQAWPTALIFKIIDRSGKMRDAPRDAMAADVSARKNRAANFGILQTLDHLGAVCGIIVSIILIRYLPIRTIFLLAVIPTLLGAAAVYIFIKEKKPKEKLYAGMRWRDLSKQFKWFLVLSAIFAMASFSYSFLLIFAKHFGFAIVTVPVLYLIFMITASLTAYPLGRLADVFGRKIIILTGFVSWGFTLLCLIQWQTMPVICASFVLYGISKGAVDTVQKAYVSELAPKRYRASALGTFKMVTGLSALPASLMAGVLWNFVDVFTPFYVSLWLTIAATFMLLFMKEK